MCVISTVLHIVFVLVLVAATAASIVSLAMPKWREFTFKNATQDALQKKDFTFGLFGRCGGSGDTESMAKACEGWFNVSSQPSSSFKNANPEPEEWPQEWH